MATIRNADVTINFSSCATDDTPVSLTGEEGTKAYQQLYNYFQLGIGDSLTYEDGGVKKVVAFKCICGYTVDQITETEVPDAECVQYCDC